MGGYLPEAGVAAWRERDHMCKRGLQQERVRWPVEASSLLSDLVDGIPREMKVVACHFYG